MGYGKDVNGHGFRSMTRTIMNEVLGERVDFIKNQFAHAVEDPNGRALQLDSASAYPND